MYDKQMELGIYRQMDRLSAADAKTAKEVFKTMDAEFLTQIWKPDIYIGEKLC